MKKKGNNTAARLLLQTCQKLVLCCNGEYFILGWLRTNLIQRPSPLLLNEIIKIKPILFYSQIKQKLKNIYNKCVRRVLFGTDVEAMYNRVAVNLHVLVNFF